MPRNLLAERKPRNLLAGMSEPSSRSNLLTNPTETLLRSGGEFLGGIKEAVVHPVQTVKALGSLGTGAVLKSLRVGPAGGIVNSLLPEGTTSEDAVDAVGNFVLDRYGSVDKATDTILEDPVGFASDISILFTGGGAVATKVGQASKISRLAKVGETATKIGKTVDPLGAVVRGGGRVIKKAAKGRKISPFAKSVDADTVRAAQEIGVDLPASAKTSSRIAPIAEAFTLKGLFGQKLATKFDNAKKVLVQVADDTIKKIGASDDLGLAGDAASKGADRFRQRFFDIKNKLYEKANFSKRAKTIPVNTSESVSLLDDLLSKKESAGKILPKSKVTGLKELKEIQKNLKKPVVNASDVDNALNELNQTLFNSSDPVITGNKAQLRKLSTTLSQEMDSAVLNFAPDLAKDIKRANDFFRLSLKELNSQFGKKILSLKDQPDKIVPELLKTTTSADDVKRIYRLIGNDNVANVQASFLRRFFDNAKNTEGLIKPSGVVGQIKRFGMNKLEKILPSNQVKALKNIDKVARGLGRAESVAKGSQTAFSIRLMFEFAPLFQGNPLGTLGLIFGDKLLSNFITSSAGQKLLTTGQTLSGGVGKRIISSADKSGLAGRVLRTSDIANQDSAFTNR